MALSLVINTLIMNYVTDNCITLVNAFITIFRALIEQNDCKYIKTNCRKGSKMFSSVFICQVVIWYFMSFTISKSFTGLLLKTFFNIKYIPVVNTLEEIRDKKELSIGGDFNYLSGVAKIFHFDIDDILKRMDEDKNHFPNFATNAANVINSKSAILLNTLMSRVFMGMTKFYNDKIHLSSNKYFPEFATFLVNRQSKFSKIIIF